MYNQNASCCYLSVGTSEAYQAAMLEVFELDSPDTLSHAIDAMYTQIKDTPSLTTLLMKVSEMYTWTTPDTAIYLLFSYDFFEYTHVYISSILNGRESKVAYDILFSKLQ